MGYHEHFSSIFAGNNDNSWGGQNVRKSYDNNYYNNNRGDYQHDGGNKIEQRMQNIRLDSGHSSSGGNKAATAEHKEQGPKKMTWANIASQPAKPQISTTSTTVKKKVNESTIKGCTMSHFMNFYFILGLWTSTADDSGQAFYGID